MQICRKSREIATSNFGIRQMKLLLKPLMITISSKKFLLSCKNPYQQYHQQIWKKLPGNPGALFGSKAHTVRLISSSDGISSFGFISEDKEMKEGREQQGKHTTDQKPLKRFSNDVIPHILNLYGSSATPGDFEIYAPNASFEDPLMCAHGVKQIKSAFYSISKVFSESKIMEYSIQENAISPGKGEVLIDNKQYYKFLGKDINMISLIKLRIEEGKVVRHEDWWDKKPLWNRDTVKLPLLGRLVETARRGSMLATHFMMRFGKEPH